MTTKTTAKLTKDQLAIANKSLLNPVNTGSLFINDRRRNDNDPQFTGRFNFGGQPAYIASWVRKQGDKQFMSFSITHAVTRETLAQGRFERNTECDVTRNHPTSVGTVSKTGQRVAVWKKSPVGKQQYLFVTLDTQSIIDNSATIEDF